MTLPSCNSLTYDSFRHCYATHLMNSYYNFIQTVNRAIFTIFKHAGFQSTRQGLGHDCYLDTVQVTSSVTNSKLLLHTWANI